MKRRAAPIGIRIMRVLAWVVVGAVATYLSTWAVVWFAHSRGEILATPTVNPPIWPAWISASWPAPREQHRIRSWWGQVDMYQPADWREPGYLQVQCGAMGVPWNALEWRFFEYAIDPTHTRAEYSGGWRFDRNRISVLPFRPLWPGFALNTLFYAALAWGLWQLPLALRRRSRSKKGLCVRCGYDLKGLAPGATCPECGPASGVRG